MEMLINEMGLEDVIVDLVNSLSSVKDLSELNCQAADEKELIHRALSVLIKNQDMERCSFFILDEQDILVNLTGISARESSSEIRAEYQPLQFKVGEGVVGVAALTGELQYCQNCLEDDIFASNNNTFLDKYHTLLRSVSVLFLLLLQLFEAFLLL